MNKNDGRPGHNFPITFSYHITGLRIEVDKFFVFALGLFLVSLAASSIAFFFSAVVRIFAVANLLIAMAFVVMMVGLNLVLRFKWPLPIKSFFFSFSLKLSH